MEWVYDRIRSQVSKDKKVDRNVSGNLDMSYVTDRVIAMSYPAEGIESTYRNYYKDVARYLDVNHKDHYRIWNLSSRPYSQAQNLAFHGAVEEMGFLDHHAPSFVILLDIIRSIHSYLAENESKELDSDKNVAVIHCLAGKGRTGTVIAAYLYYSSFFESVSDCMRYFASQRSLTGSGIQQPSQIRYVNYFASFLNLSKSLPPSSLLHLIHPDPSKSIILSSITFRPLPPYSHRQGIRPWVIIYPMLTHYLDSGNYPAAQSFEKTPPLYNLTHNTAGKYTHYKPPLSELRLPVDVPVCGDILINVYHMAKHVGGVYLENRIVFRYQFNTEFLMKEYHDKVDESGRFQVEVGKSELDQGWNDDRMKEGFKMTMDFQVLKDGGERRNEKKMLSDKCVEWKQEDVLDFISEWDNLRKKRETIGFVNGKQDMEKSWWDIGSGMKTYFGQDGGGGGGEKESDAEEDNCVPL